MNIYHRNLQKLVTGIFEVKNCLSTKLMNDLFEYIEKPYSLRTNSHFSSKRIRATKYVIETHSYIGPKLWTIFQNKYKAIASLPDFKIKMKTWVPENSPCNLCKTCIHQIRFT